MIVFNVIMIILIIGFHILLPIVHIIKKSIDTSNEKKKWNFSVFFENLFIVIIPWLVIALSLILFFGFYMLFDNLFVSGLFTVIIVVIVLKLLDIF